VLQQLTRDYPTPEYAQQADYHISKLQKNAASPAENLANLQKVAPGNPNYLPARYDICIILHGQWKTATGTERRRAGDALLAAANTYLQAANSSRNGAQKVKVSSLAASVTLGRKPADVALAGTYLNRADAWANALPASSNVAAEYHYYAMKLAESTKQEAARASHAKWLAENSQGSPFELSGLVAAAKSADVAAKLAGDSGPNQAVGEAHRIYSRLSQLFGDSPQALAKQKNARVAMSKAAGYADQLGDHREAAERLDKLLAALSGEATKSKSYVRRAGLAHFSAGQYDKSLQHWRMLLAGLKKGSADWYEAKYYQMACLARLDPSKFKSVLKQFQLLYPNVPQPWKDRIAALTS
jgi:tetratricopeptide (TPR) repeat protein